MKILHVGPLTMDVGGPALSTYYTVKGLSAAGVDVSLLTRYPEDDQTLFGTDIQTMFWEDSKEHFAGYRKGVNRTLSSLEKPDLIHMQGIWLYQYHQIAKYAKQHGIPYILTPRGSLYPQALQVSKLKKKLSRAVYQDKDLQNAACIQVTCKEELEHYRNLGFTNPAAIIPNPIDVHQFEGHEPTVKDTIKIGYLGRLHQRKRVERIFEAVSLLGDKATNIEIEIIGGGEADCEAFLRETSKKLSLKKVNFRGFLVGEEKDKAISELSLLVLPSDYENFGNVVTEALVRGVPAVVTKGAPWEGINENHCGWWIENSVENIASSIEKFLDMTPAQRLEMGKNAQNFIFNTLSVESVTAMYLQLYDWILNKSGKPDFVFD